MDRRISIVDDEDGVGARKHELLGDARGAHLEVAPGVAVDRLRIGQRRIAKTLVEQGLGNPRLTHSGQTDQPHHAAWFAQDRADARDRRIHIDQLVVDCRAGLVIDDVRMACGTFRRPVAIGSPSAKGPAALSQ